MFNDLREFITQADKLGECKFVEGADWDLEIGGITELEAYNSVPRLLVFDRVKGYEPGYRVASLALLSDKRLLTTLGLPLHLKGIGIVNAWRDKIREEFKPVKPVEVKTGPINENILTGDQVDLFKFPAPRWHELDGGRFIGTGDMVIQRDPDTGWVNFGTYRVQIHDKNTVGFHTTAIRHGNYIAQRYWEKGQNCPVVIVCGEDPLLWLVATSGLPRGVGEYDYAGWLRNKPFEVVKGETVDLPIPAAAEIALEGEILPPKVETRMEGPFGEWEGYYGGAAAQDPVIKINAIKYRNNPIILGAPPVLSEVGSIGRVDFQLSAQLWDELDKNAPGIKGVWFIPAARSWQIVVISLKQAYPGHAKQVALFASGSYKGQATIGKAIIIVDEDIDPSNMTEVLWALGTRWDPATGTDIIAGCPSMRSDPRVSPDQRAVRDYVSSRALIYACKPYSWIKDFSPSIRSSPEHLEKIKAKWGKILSER